jgi:hypothetical protein
MIKTGAAGPQVILLTQQRAEQNVLAFKKLEVGNLRVNRFLTLKWTWPSHHAA